MDEWWEWRLESWSGVRSFKVLEGEGKGLVGSRHMGEERAGH